MAVVDGGAFATEPCQEFAWLSVREAAMQTALFDSQDTADEAATSIL